jgi:hypothetical protein
LFRPEKKIANEKVAFTLLLYLMVSIRRKEKKLGKSETKETKKNTVRLMNGGTH